MSRSRGDGARRDYGRLGDRRWRGAAGRRRGACVASMRGSTGAEPADAERPAPVRRPAVLTESSSSIPTWAGSPGSSPGRSR
jgi:hypothetical protein